MSSEWPVAPLASIAVQDSGFIGGPFGSSLGRRDYVQSGVPVVRGANVQGPVADFSDATYVTEQKATALARCLARPGDIVMTQRGTLGQVATLPDDFSAYLISQSQMAIRVDPCLADPQYVLYALRTLWVRKQIADRAIVTGVPHLNLGIFKELTISTPPLADQRRVAAVLHALDDKIASNRRLAALLLAIVEAVFAHALNRSRGEAITLGDLGTIRGGGTPKTKVPEYWAPAEVVWATPKDMTALRSPVISCSERCISREGLANSSAILLPAGTVLYTSRATLGHVAIAAIELATNQGFITVEPAPGFSSAFVLVMLRHRNDAIIAKANGSTFLEVNKTNFKTVECMKPSEEALAEFDAVAVPAMAKVESLEDETATLQRIHAELLPKLVSGEIRVSPGGDEGGPVELAA